MARVTFDAESFRSKHESNADWKVKRAFLISNEEYFINEIQLGTMANCYVNVRCYGCSYPDGVMTRLNEFENNIDRQLIDNYQPTPKNVRTILKAKNKRNKVKGENSEEATDDKTQEASEQITIPEDYEFKDVVKKFRELKKNIPKKCEDKSQLLQQLKIAIDKAQMTTTVNYQEVPNEGYSCSVLIDNVFVAKGTAPNKKQAKGNAYENALELLQKDALIVEKKVSEEEDEDSEQLVLVVRC